MFGRNVWPLLGSRAGLPLRHPGGRRDPASLKSLDPGVRRGTALRFGTVILANTG